MSKLDQLRNTKSAPRSPRRHTPSNRMPTGQSNGAFLGGVAGTSVLSQPYSGPPSESVTMGSGGAESFKMKSKHTEKTSVSEKEEPFSDKNAHHKGNEGKHIDGNAWGWSAIVWIIVFFVIILFIVMVVFWWFQPDCVTRKCEDKDDCELDLCRAALYAFVIAFFLVFIFGAIWFCACR